MDDPEKLLLICEDDDDDYFMMLKAIEDASTDHILIERFGDGEGLFNFLYQNGQVSNISKPVLILLDLNMPRKDGRQTLMELKTNENLKKIPVIVFTTSEAESDVLQCYELGASAYFVKPSNFNAFRDMLHAIVIHWFRFAQLPAC